MVGRPSEADFKSMVRLNLLKNLPVTSKAIKNAYKIFGPDVPALKGHTVRQAAPRAEFDEIPLPAGLQNLEKEVEVCGDIMFINGLPFLTSVTRRLQVRTVQHMAKRRKGFFNKRHKSYNKLL